LTGKTTTPVVVVNEALAKMMCRAQERSESRFSIVTEPELLPAGGPAVVGTAVIGQIGEDPSPSPTSPCGKNTLPEPHLCVRTNSNPEPLIGAVRAQVQPID